MKPYKLFLLAIVLILMPVLMGLTWGEENQYFKWITPQELKAKLDDVGASRQSGTVPFVLIDSRSPGRYLAGHIKGARHIPWKEMQISDLPADKRAMIVFYCDGPG